MKELVYIIHSPPFWIKTPPLSLLFLKNYLKEKGIEAKIIDLNITIFKLLSLPKKVWLTLNEEFEKNLFFLVEKKFPNLLTNLYRKIKDAGFVGFSLFKRNAPFAFLLAERIRNKFPYKRIVFGGPHTLFLEQEDKLDCKNFWVVGEGEIPLYEIAAKGNKKIYRFQEIENLDCLSFPNYNALNLNLYTNYLPLLSSRGCPYQCSFCSERKLFKKFRYHSPEYIAEEIKCLLKTYNINTFIFCDSLINYKNNWLQKLCSLIIKYNLKIKWEGQMRIDKNLPQDLAHLIKKSGCYNLFVGLESGCDKVLKAMNKGFSAADAVSFFKTLTKAGIHFEVSLIVGYPTEEEKDFNEAVNFIINYKKIIPKIAQINPFVDYLNQFPKSNFPSQEAIRKAQIILERIKEEKIKYTKSFINNLIYLQNQ